MNNEWGSIKAFCSETYTHAFYIMKYGNNLTWFYCKQSQEIKLK